MRYLLKLPLICSLLTTGCSTISDRTSLSDLEIESLLIGNWFVSPLDTEFYTGNAISSYTKGNDFFFIAYADRNCQIQFLEAQGLWKVKNKQLIITVLRSNNHNLLPPGFVSTDDILFIDDETKILKDINDKHKQIRTKTSTCKAIETQF